jgi:hypothetical protein
MLLMIAMVLMTVVSGQSGFRHQDQPGPKRSSEHQRGNRLDRAHCNLLFVWVALQDIIEMLRATSAAPPRLIIASSLARGMVDRYAPFNEPGLNRSRPPIGGHSAHLIQIRAFISTARFDTWPRVPLLLSTLGMLELAELRWSRGTAFDRVADRHDNFSCNGAHMQSRGTGLSDLFLNQRGALGDNSHRRLFDAAGPGRSSDLEGAVARGSIGIPNSNATCMRFRP